MKQLTSIFIPVLLILAACQSADRSGSTAKSSPVTPDTLSYNYDSVKVYSKNPVSKNKDITDTAKATFLYPVFNNTRLNKLVEATAIRTDNPDDRAYTSYKDLATSFIQSFDDYDAETFNNEHTWFREVKIRVLPQSGNYLSLEYSFAEYIGGAHINSGVTYQNYRVNDLQLLQLKDIIQPGEMDQLNKIAEKIFRKNEGLPASGSLEPDYFFEKGIFKLNDNFCLTKKGIQFLYNSYEIKAFAYGRTRLFIPYSAVQGIIKPEFVLS